MFNFLFKKLAFLFFILYIFLPILGFSEVEADDQKDNIKNNEAFQFLTLPGSKEIRQKNNLGKIDPFILNNLSENNIFGNLKLIGVISSNNKRSVLVKFKDKTGELEEGDIGGISTNLLPKSALLKTIKINPSYLILKFNKKEYKISL